MDTNRIPKQALQYKPKWRRNIGRPRKRWRDQLHLEDQGTGNTPNPSGTWCWWWWWWWCPVQTLPSLSPLSPYSFTFPYLSRVAKHLRITNYWQKRAPYLHCCMRKEHDSWSNYFKNNFAYCILISNTLLQYRLSSQEMPNKNKK